MRCTNGLRGAVFGVRRGSRAVLTWALGARVALHPGIALGETVFVGFRAAAEGLGEARVVSALGLDGVLGAVVVLLLVALVVVRLVAAVTALLLEVGVVTGSRAAVVEVLGSALVLVDVHVATLLVVSWGLTVALNPDIAVLLYVSRRRAITLNPDIPLDVRRVGGLGLRLGLGLGRFLMDVDIDVRLLVGRFGLLGLLDWLQSSQVADDLAETGMRDGELLLPVLELLLLAEQPVDAVPHADAAAVLDIAGDAFRVRRDVLKGAAHVAHASVDPL